MAKTHPPYPEAFRWEAVQLARSSDKSVPGVAKDLGISDQACATGCVRPTLMTASAKG